MSLEYQLPPSNRIAARMLDWLRLPGGLPPEPQMQHAPESLPDYFAQARQAFGIPPVSTAEPAPRPPTRLGIEPDAAPGHQHEWGFSRRGLTCQRCLLPYVVALRQARGR